jgi:hypothetical protein
VPSSELNERVARNNQQDLGNQAMPCLVNSPILNGRNREIPAAAMCLLLTVAAVSISFHLLQPKETRR